ncbi:OmpA family protein [Hyphomonas pacifica]|uniref:Uncharacterized protein n=1 Tax=Hyphomonas pacifica TaxID=1280941 RepID=A0A062TZ50_9PROT|nr:OmpA family protein [Hyphomonas pacifica]KCZ45519.1 hypothetical protein HY2_06700 [Hyphomonas pacifica]RAN34195.1 hypothetical protein HY11_15445 [Hyphomonas pacifica]RAN35691.1 hypothetical protein HY3_07670 [Hyphomonas pacifica]
MKILSLTLASAVTATMAAHAELPAPPQNPVIYKDAPKACTTEEFTIYFERGVTRLGDQADAVLDAVADDLSDCRYARIEVTGHSDAAGPVDLNRKVSDQRAQAVVEGLKARNITAGQIGIEPKGEARAYAVNGYAEPLNRKATVRLVPVNYDQRAS